MKCDSMVSSRAPWVVQLIPPYSAQARGGNEIHLGLEGLLGSAWLSGIVCFCCMKFWASGDSWAPAVGYCLFFSSEILGLGGLLLQLSGIAYYFCLNFWASGDQLSGIVRFLYEILGLGGLLDSSCRVLHVCSFRMKFGASGDSWTPGPQGACWERSFAAIIIGVLQSRMRSSHRNHIAYMRSLCLLLYSHSARI